MLDTALALALIELESLVVIRDIRAATPSMPKKETLPTDTASDMLAMVRPIIPLIPTHHLPVTTLGTVQAQFTIVKNLDSVAVQLSPTLTTEKADIHDLTSTLDVADLTTERIIY